MQRAMLMCMAHSVVPKIKPVLCKCHNMASRRMRCLVLCLCSIALCRACFTRTWKPWISPRAPNPWTSPTTMMKKNLGRLASTKLCKFNKDRCCWSNRGILLWLHRCKLRGCRDSRFWVIISVWVGRVRCTKELVMRMTYLAKTSRQDPIIQRSMHR